MNASDDASLVSQFLNREAFAANQNLRVEPVFDSVQLLAKRGGMVATLKIIKGIKTVTLRKGSEYSNLVHHVLIENNYIPVSQSSQAEVIQYKARHIPAGYKLHCAEARLLWKEWWTGTRDGNRNSIQTDLLIYTRNTWYPIREVTCSQGALFVTTLVSEFVFQGSDQVIWLTKSTAESHQNSEQIDGAKERAKAFLAATRSGSRLFSNQPIAPTNQQTVAALPTPGSGTCNRTQQDEDIHPDLRQVVKFRQGKLYITTALGEIVVEGTNLKFWLDDGTQAGSEQSDLARKPIDFGSYLERETRAV